MNSFILALGQGCSWSPEEWSVSQGGTRAPNGQVIIEDNSGWLSVLRDDTIIDDFDNDERTSMLSLVNSPAMFLIEWTEGKLADRMLRAIPADCDAAIDNDHGILDCAHRVRDVPIREWATASKLPPSLGHS